MFIPRDSRLVIETLFYIQGRQFILRQENGILVFFLGGVGGSGGQKKRGKGGRQGRRRTLSSTDCCLEIGPDVHLDPTLTRPTHPDFTQHHSFLTSRLAAIAHQAASDNFLRGVEGGPPRAWPLHPPPSPSRAQEPPPCPPGPTLPHPLYSSPFREFGSHQTAPSPPFPKPRRFLQC